MEQVDSIASRYGALPSLLLGVEDPLEALSVNLWAHNWGVQRENRERYLARVKAKHGL